ncbi:unnamed protein product [Effrenium voratum]|uniref:Uncharacterized protein n=1 Tax=Effrenium voratum TaxID=2562239 RepID=A0AA36HK73_9DINO|nr:unnamed protein product [Effrenium voratum]
MTILPSIMSSSQLAKGHIYHTSSMPPRSRTLSPAHTLRHGSLDESTKSRTRTEWLSTDLAKMSGEIRNIHVLGIIHGNLVVSFQGAGRVRVFVNNEHSLELPETNRLGSTSPFGIDWTKKYSKYITNCGGLRFAEFNLRALPTQVLVVGETTPSVEKLIPATRPVSEARTLARITVSGHVETQRRFHSNLGVPGHPIGLSWSGLPGNMSLAEGTGCLPQSGMRLPPATAGKHYQKLSASQKSFHGVD